MRLSEKDLEFTAIRAVGQKSNESDRGCQVLHLPTGVRAGSTRYRTRLENKAVALRSLEDILIGIEWAGREPDRPSWDDYFLGIAQAVAARADCSRKQVGSVIVDGLHRIVSTGYNGSAPGGPSCLAGACPRASSDVAPLSSYDTGPGSCISVHSEANALLYAGITGGRGATLYTTYEPCDGCRKLIAAAGIARVVVAPRAEMTA